MEPIFENETQSYSNTDYSNVQSHEGHDSWKVMVERLVTDVGLLLRKEKDLVRSEVSEKITDIKTAAIPLAAGGGLIFFGAFALIATMIIGLSYLMPLFAASLIVTVLLLVVGAVMVVSAKKKLAANNLKLTRSIETFGDIKSTLKERMYEFRKH